MLGESQQPTLEHYGQLRYCMRAVCESMRLYPHPPVLLRRALVDDTLPGMHGLPCMQTHDDPSNHPSMHSLKHAPTLASAQVATRCHAGRT